MANDKSADAADKTLAEMFPHLVRKRRVVGTPVPVTVQKKDDFDYEDASPAQYLELVGGDAHLLDSAKIPRKLEGISLTSVDGSKTLRPYQVAALIRLAKRRGRSVLALEPGMGKTAIACKLIRPLTKGRVLIVSPKNATAVWRRELPFWMGEHATVIAGSPAKRRELLANAYANTSCIVIINYELLKDIVDKYPYWAMVILDEGHKIRNRKTIAFNNVKRLKSAHFLDLTGTPVVKGAQDLWPPLHICSPSEFGSYWRFVNKYAITYDNGFGQVIKGVSRENAPELQKTLKPFFVRYLKKEVMQDLPPKIRRPIYVEMTPKQDQAYQQMTEELMLEIDDLTVLAPNELTKIMRLRQLLITPELFGGERNSALLDALKESVEQSIEAGRPMIIFTPFRKAIPAIVETIKPLLGDNIWLIHGGLKQTSTYDELDERRKAFEECPSNTKAIVAVIKSGTSWTATSAVDQYFVGYEWTAFENIQAEDRSHRHGLQRDLVINYFVHENTIDEHILKIVENEADWADLATDPARLMRPKEKYIELREKVRKGKKK